MGPTASGKTALAVELVERYPFEIISVDSALVYRDMNIGTAKPDATLLARAPHHLLDLRDPAESYSAAEFCQDAERAMHKIRDNGKVPLFVGGTMLYYRALSQGLSPLPEADPLIRQQLQQRLQHEGLATLHAELAAIDPASAQRIDRNDPQRTLRALEVHQITGRTMTQIFAEQSKPALQSQILKLAILPEERLSLHERIAQRFDDMLAAGFVEEVQGLYARPELDANKPAMRTVGYRQIWQYLAGDMDYDSMRERGIIATRQLAKRQLTWLRSEADVTNLSLQSLDRVSLYSMLEAFLDM